ncbi:MAG TPA: adenylate/guanylate cyclase domain-containing protein [Desulfobulbaceae bacterium]|nr:adenylate/guanylate cyclase domain-containing protein [Desulfobulbaceae bacterium]
MKFLIKKSSSLAVPLAGFAATLLVALLYVYQPAWLRNFDHRLYDTVLKQGHNTGTRNAVAIVDLDEKSLQRYGQWPWPRYRMALLLKKLQEAGALAVGMDILFAEPDRSSPAILRQELKRDLDVDMDFAGLPEALRDNDQILATTLREGPFVLGFFFEFAKKEPLAGPVHVKDIDPARLTKDEGVFLPDLLFSAPSLLQPLANLAEAASATGFINTIRDQDGVLRSTPVLMAHNGKIYANLGLSVLWTALGQPPCIVKYSASGTEAIRMGGTTVPLDEQGRVWLHYRGPGRTFPYYSAGDILADAVPAAELAGKMVLIGTSAVGLHDLRTTPFDSEFPGVEAHATLIDTILAGDYIRAPGWLPGLELCLTIGAGIATTLLLCRLSAGFIMPIILLFIGLCGYASLWAFNQHHFFFSPLFPILATGLNFSLLSFLKFLRSDEEKRFIRKAFSKFVSSTVVDRIVASPERLSLEGEDKEVSILFSDIRGFSTFSEQLAPSQLSELLKSYLTPMTRIIIQQSGTLDKFIGDAVMAFWNAPVEIDRHRYRAVSAGLAMLAALPELNEKFREQFGLTLKIGIGIHAGRAIVGNMGSEDLFDYTVIGDNVNLASRLEGLTKYYDLPILVTDAMAAVSVDGYTIQEVDRATVKGKGEAVTLYTFRANDTVVEGEQARWAQVLELYRSCAFREALPVLDQLMREQPLISLYRLYRERCQAFLVTPPPADWDCIYCHLSK